MGRTRGIGEGRAARPRRAPAAALALATAWAAGFAAASPFGVNAHVPGADLLDRIAAGGARWVRVDVLWSWVEPYPDRFDWTLYDDLVAAAEARGLRLYATIADTPAWATAGAAGRGVPRDPADWYDVCHRAAARYRGRIDHWGMWNEPNDARFWAGTKTQYIDVILKPGAAAVHAASPGARVCGPELAHLESGHWDTWLREVLRRAGGDLDVVTHHLYPDGASSRSVVDMLAKGSRYPWDPPSVRSVLADAGWLGKPFWLTETGCSSGSNGNSAQAQAGFVGALSRALFGPDRSLAWVHRVFFYEAADDPRYAPGLGLLGPAPEYREKPAWAELVRTARDLPVDDAEVVRADVPDWLPAGGAASGVVLVRNAGTTAWSAADGYRLAVTGGDARLAAGGGELDAGVTVRPGETVALAVELEARAGATAPGATLPVSWQMSRYGRWEFGDTARAEVAVGDGGTARPRLVPLAGAVADASAAPPADLVLHNRGAVELSATVELIAAGAGAGTAPAVGVGVPAGATVVFTGIAASLPGAASGGALRVTAPSSDLLVATAAGNAAGFFGVIPALPTSAAVAAGGEAHLLRLVRADDGAALRTDLVLLNDSALPAAVDVEVRGDGEREAHSLALALAPGEIMVVEDVLAAAGIAAAHHGRALLRPGAASAEVHAWALRREAGTTPVVLQPAAATDEPVVLAPLAGGARLRGGGWRSDIQLANPGKEPVRVVLELLAPAGVAAPAREVEVPSGGDLVIADALATLFSYRGSGGLLVTPRSGSVAAAAGSLLARAGARARREVAPLALGAAVGEGNECRLLVPPREPAGPPVRTHLELANLTGAPLVVRARALAAAGAPLGEITVDLAPREFRQVADALPAAPGGDGAACALALDTVTPCGRFAAAATVVPEGSTGGALVPCLR